MPPLHRTARFLIREGDAIGEAVNDATGVKSGGAGRADGGLSIFFAFLRDFRVFGGPARPRARPPTV